MLPLLLLATATAEAPPHPAMAKEHKMVVEAVRGCPEPVEGEIVVCSRDRGVAEGFRLPRLDPRFAGPLAKNGRTALTDPALGTSGIGSCTDIGAGGSSGCGKRDYSSWKAWQLQQKKDADAYASPH